jgi:hypothetical protein
MLYITVIKINLQPLFKLNMQNLTLEKLNPILG